MDRYPEESKTSDLKTSPPPSTASIKRKKPVQLTQLGKTASYVAKGELLQPSGRPSYYEMAAWDQARREEPILRRGFEIIRLSILAKIGSYEHPDPEINDFVQANIANSVDRWLSDILQFMLPFGNATSEINWKYKTGPKGLPQLWIDSIVPYHPSQSYYILNDNGILTDGENLICNPVYKSGVWVVAPTQTLINQKLNSKSIDYVGNLIRLPRGKYFYANTSIDPTNPYGTSILEPIIKYFLYKDVFLEMMMTALDRHGTPLIYVLVPPQDTREVVEEADGTIRPKSLQELTQEQLQDLSSNNALVFTQTSKDQPVEVKALTTGNNFADSFDTALTVCDSNMLMGIGVPNLLMKDNNNGLGSSGAASKQLEVFDLMITSQYRLLIRSFLRHVVRPLIQFNFDPKLNPKSYIDGTFTTKPTRKEQLETTVKAIEMMTQNLWLSPKNNEHRRYVSDVLEVPYTQFKQSDLIDVDQPIPQAVTTPTTEAVAKPPAITKAPKDAA